MNILIIGSSDIMGGAALSVWNLRNLFERRGHAVKFLVGYKRSGDPGVEELSGSLGGPPVGSYVKKYYSALRTYACANDIDFGVSAALFNHPWYRQADIINCQNLHGNYFALSNLIRMSKEKKVIWTLHDEWAIMGHGAWSDDRKPSNGFFRRSTLLSYPPMLWDNTNYLQVRKARIYRQSDISIIVPSIWLKRRVASSVLAGKRISYIPYGVDTHLFRAQSKQKARSILGLPQDKKIVICISNFGKHNPQKGWKDLRSIGRLLASDSGITFLCIGGSPADQMFSTQATTYIPYVSDPRRLALYYAAADVLLLPSEHENLPLVVLEAQASGLPVVAYDVGGVGDAVKHKKNGYIAAKGDTHDAVRGIRYVLGLPAARYAAMSASAIKQIRETFSLSLMAEKYIKLYSTL